MRGEIPSNTVVYGDQSVLRPGMKHLGLEVALNVTSSPSNLQANRLNLIDLQLLSESDWKPAQLNANAGSAAFEYVVEATTAAMRDEVSAIVTLPMNKEATQRSHLEFTGHTELLAKLCEVDQVVMMLATDQVAVSHVSTHVSLQQAIELLTQERLSSTIQLTHQSLQRFIDNPRIGVCGLNPHAGESGMFGTEEQLIIEPVIQKLQQQSMKVSGPFPADTVFRQAIVLDQFDSLICMYHDQGHAPMKLHAFDSAVNVTLGLPIIRTSVDHGTAFDIAWQGVASTNSLKSAIAYASRLISTQK